MKYFKTYEGLFDSTEPTTDLLISLKNIDSKYQDVLLKWFEDAFKEEFDESDLERYYRTNNTSGQYLKQTITSNLIKHFPLIRSWIEQNNISKAKLLAMKWNSVLTRFNKNMNDEYHKKGKISWNPKQQSKYFNDPQFEETDNPNWTWFSFVIIDETDFFKTIQYAFSPEINDNNTEDLEYHVLYNNKTFQLYVIIVVEYKNIQDIYRNRDFIIDKDIVYVDQEINKYINKKMGNNFDGLEYQSDSIYDVDWKTFFPVFKKFNSKQQLIPYYRAYQSGALSYDKFKDLLQRHFNNLIFIDKDAYITIDNYSDFSDFFVKDQQEYIDDLFNGEIYNNYSESDYDWHEYWNLTDDDVKNKMINDINTNFNENIKINDFNTLKKWITDNSSANRALNIAAANSQFYADEAAANKVAEETIREKFDFKWSEKHNSFLVKVNNWLDQLLRSNEYNPENYNDLKDFIQEWLDDYTDQLEINIPEYGWQGEVDANLWMEELDTEWENV